MSDPQQYDLIIIGAGPGGYVAAERAGARGKKVCIIEKNELGGVCLNVGCIPSKTLLHSAKVYSYVTHAGDYAVDAGEPKLDLEALMKRKQKVVSTLVKGVGYQMKRFNVDVVHGAGKLVDRRTVQVGDDRYTAGNIIIATGSRPMVPPIDGVDQDHVVDSTGILEVESLPENLAIIGGGVIGTEFASFFSQLGVNVTVLEMLPEILPNFDEDIAKALKREMRAVTWNTGCQVKAVTRDSVVFIRDGEEETIPADKVLLSVGRRPNVEDLGLEAVGIDFDRGGIKVNEQMQTNVPGIYAIGDVNGQSLLAHSASRMGEVAVNVICGEADRMRYDGIPWVVYSNPEVGGVGLNEQVAAKRGIEVEVTTLQMRANGRFLSENASGKSGVCKVLTAPDTGVLLGVTIVGNPASEIIHSAAAMVEAEFRVRDIREVVFPHPTVSEIFRDTLWEVGH